MLRMSKHLIGCMNSTGNAILVAKKQVLSRATETFHIEYKINSINSNLSAYLSFQLVYGDIHKNCFKC